MLRNWLAGTAGALFLAFAPLTAQTTASTTTDCLSGRARGAWDLPVKGEPGMVRGLLGDGAGRRLALQGRLIPAGDSRGGFIEGRLTPLTPNGFVVGPIAEVHGAYSIGPDGRGRFEAALLGITRGDKRPELVGKFGGSFADPMREGRDTVGNFVGRWAICR